MSVTTFDVKMSVLFEDFEQALKRLKGLNPGDHQRDAELQDACNQLKPHTSDDGARKKLQEDILEKLKDFDVYPASCDDGHMSNVASTQDSYTQDDADSCFSVSSTKP